MTNREMLLQLAMDMPEDRARIAIDAIAEAFAAQECESCMVPPPPSRPSQPIRLMQVEQGGHATMLDVPPELID